MIAEKVLTERERLLTTEEVAAELRVTQHTLRRWIREGTLVGTRVGREWRIKPADLDDFIRKNRPTRDGTH